MCGDTKEEFPQEMSVADVVSDSRFVETSNCYRNRDQKTRCLEKICNRFRPTAATSVTCIIYLK